LESDLYEILGISSDADHNTIRTAYFRMARAHPPDRDPETFERVRQAYQTLSNREARQDYDAMRRFGGEIEETLIKAEQAIAEDRNEDAVRAFKRVLVLNPRLDAVRDQLAQCLLVLKRHPEAVQVLQTLVKRTPDNAVYWCHLGLALSRWANDGDTRQNEAAARFARARDAYSRAIQLEPHNPDLYRELAWTYVFQLDHAKAIEWFRKGINADDKVDLFDIDALTDICFVAAWGNLDSEFQAAYESITGIISDGPEDARDYAARCLARHGSDAHSKHVFSVSWRFFRAAHAIGLSDPEAQSILGRLVTSAGAGSEMDRLAADDSINLPFRTVIYLFVADVLDYPVSGRAGFEGKAQASLMSIDHTSLERSTRALRLSYPNIYVIAKDYVDSIKQTINGRRPVNTGSGCMIPVLVTLAIAALALIL